MKNYILILLFIRIPFYALDVWGMESVVSSHKLTQIINLSVLSAEELQLLMSKATMEKAHFEKNNQVWTMESLDQLLKTIVLELEVDHASFEKKVTSNAVIYDLQILRSEKIKTIEVKGNTDFSEEQIFQLISSHEGGRFDESILENDKAKIIDFYEQEGFYKAHVQWSRQKINSTEIKLSFYITPGPQTFVRKVKVESENTDFNKLLYSFVRKMEGKPFSRKSLQTYRTDISQFLSKNRYYQAEVLDPQWVYLEHSSEVDLTLVFRKPIKYYIDFEGEWRIPEQELRSLLKLEEFRASSNRIGSEWSTKIKNYYLSKGFSRSEVSFKESEDSTNFVKSILIQINEGELVKIANIHFQGYMSLKSDEYKKLFYELSSGPLKDKIYVKDEVDRALNHFIIERQNQGYFRARILSSRIAYNDKKNSVDLYIHWDEGPLTSLEFLKLEGNKSFPDSELSQILGFTLKKPLKLMELEQSLENLKNFYQEHGYLEMKILNEKSDLVYYTEGNTQVHLHIKIHEGPKIIVGSILIEGNTLTKDAVILKEIDFKEGEVLTPQLLNESTGRLQRLGFFSSVEIKTLEENTMQSVRTILIRVQDTNPGLFEIGSGFNNERGLTLRGYSGISYRNIGGWGRGISARADVKYNVTMIRYLESKISLGYLEPYLLDTRTKGRINLTRTVFISDFDITKGSQVNQITYSLEQDITTHLFASWDVWSLATIRDFYIDSNTDIQLLDIATTTPSLTFDYRDNPFNPKSGFITKISLEHSDPKIGSSRTIEYNKYYASFTHYFPILKSGWVWANHFRWGYLVNYNSDKDGGVPYDKKGLTLGGQSTIRGYSPDEAFPNKYELGSDTYNLKSSATMKLIKSEVRFPLSKFNSWDLFGALFYDGGSVVIDGLNYWPTYRHSAGFAIRANFPVGAIGLDFGWKLNPQGSRFDNPMVINLEVGTF